MPFFEDSFVEDLAEKHVERLTRLEQRDAEILIRRYKEIRRDLRDRLDRLPEQSFSAQQLRGVMVQVDLAIQSMNQSLVDRLFELAEDAAERGVDDLLEEIRKFDRHFTGAVVPINVDAAVIVSDANNLLVNKYESSLRAYGEDVRSTIAATLSQGVIEQVSSSVMVRRLSQFFEFEEFKLQRIARTELHGVYGLAKQRTLEDAAEIRPDIKKALWHPMDSRTAADSKQLAKADPIVPVDEPFRFTFRRKRKDGTVVTEDRVFMTPPDRPNDRAIMIPYREAWDV